MRRIVAAVAVGVGAGLVAVPLVMSLFTRTTNAEQVTDRFRHMMSKEGLVELRTDFETVRGTGEELIGTALPGVAAKLGMTDAQFAGYLDVNFPAVARGVREVPA